MVERALVTGGGKGRRLGLLAFKYGNKSLIPIKGKPMICYTID